MLGDTTQQVGDLDQHAGGEHQQVASELHAEWKIGGKWIAKRDAEQKYTGRCLQAQAGVAQQHLSLFALKQVVKSHGGTPGVDVLGVLLQCLCH